jgi:hypothetical protein
LVNFRLLRFVLQFDDAHFCKPGADQVLPSLPQNHRDCSSASGKKPPPPLPPLLPPVCASIKSEHYHSERHNMTDISDKQFCRSQQ